MLKSEQEARQKTRFEESDRAHHKTNTEQSRSTAAICLLDVAAAVQKFPRDKKLSVSVARPVTVVTITITMATTIKINRVVPTALAPAEWFHRIETKKNDESKSPVHRVNHSTAAA